MKRTTFTISAVKTLCAAVLFTSALQAKAHARGLVEPSWVQAHLEDRSVVILDVRSSEEYAAGHIKNSVSMPFSMPVSTWVALPPSGLLMELPAPMVLSTALGAAGISKQSTVVVVGATQAPGVPAAYPLAQTARVADTLIYAGVKNVAILNGGITGWVALETEVPTRSPVEFKGTEREEMFVSEQQVARAIGKADVLLLDARDAAVYAGTVIEPFAPRAGHIPGAQSLPTPSIWNSDGTYKTPNELQSMVSSIWGGDLSDEIIVYCGVGGYASGWWFVLSEVLGYTNVKFYDGSAQEWAADPEAPLETGL